MEEIKIRTIINSTYQVFDQSGKLPFSIVFGLVRRSPKDTDPRSLLFNTAESILDVPYALSHGLLTLSAQDVDSGRDEEIDLGPRLGELSHSGIRKGGEGSFVTLSSPAGRTQNWKKALTIYHYEIDPKSSLGSIFESGRKYTIRGTAGGELGGHGHRFADEAQDLKESEGSSPSSQSIKLLSSRMEGRASFTAVPSLPWPPKIATRMQQHKSEGGGNDAIHLEITVVNTGTEALTIQTSGRQRFLVPRGPMGPEPLGSEGDVEDPRPRIIDAKAPSAASNIQIWDTKTNTIVREKTKPPTCSLYDSAKHDPRPKLETLVTLRPGEPLVRLVDVSNLLKQSDLPDGTYGLRLERRGLWWCAGSLDDFATAGEDRVPQHLFRTKIPPAIIECEDLIEVKVENGQARWID